MRETDNKLDIARYFLEQMEKYEKDGRDFQHNLNAFIVFVRSALHLLLEKELTQISRQYKKTKEIEKHQKLTNWIQQKKSIYKDPLVDFFIKKRNYILKEASPELIREINITEPIHLTETITVMRYDEHGQLIDTTSSEPSTVKLPGKQLNNQSKWIFADWQGNEHIITLCKWFLSKLEHMLKEAKEFLSRL